MSCRARLVALVARYPDWRIWLDQHVWHACRRNGYLQEHRPGAAAFTVHADTPSTLAAQPCWQQAHRLACAVRLRDAAARPVHRDLNH